MPKAIDATARRRLVGFTIHPNVIAFLQAHPGKASRMVETAVAERYGIDLGQPGPAAAAPVAAPAPAVTAHDPGMGDEAF